ncbi:VWA domain-containing protein [Paenibacillus montanisoli]|uniref:VWA domain-containing protein n=1 Tax=Paenibacillus montanisoli TaxID=2081970 RepID=A0A328U6D6_9BACL|nr:VWA domain-containing protein [Paenibacillus montanisoli]RAP77333.1 VWA domain-containing protein [Paenibacillus montanisoli]
MRQSRASQKKRDFAPNKRKVKAALLLLAAAAMLLAGCSSADEQNDSSANTATENSAPAADGDSNSAANDSSSSESKSDTTDSSHSEEPAPAPDKDGDMPIDEGEPAPGSQYDDSEPGQLTAGEWNDLLSWKEWVKLLNGGEGQDLQSYWSIFPKNRLEVEVTGGGKPVSDAEVSLVDDDGQTVWEARTDMDGKASAYAGLFDDERQGGERYGVIIRSGEQEKRYENVPIPRGSALKVNMEEAVKPTINVDLMLVVDTTGSMEDELNFLKTELKDVVTRASQDNGQQLDIRVSANFYRDRSDEYLVKDYPFTNDIDTVVKQLSQQSAAGGGDYPEAVDAALENAIDDHEWSGEARARLLFLVLDAPPHHERKAMKRIHELTETAAAEGIRIIPVASSGVDVQTEYLMRFMATATGGTYLFLTDHSGIGNEHMEPAVGEYEVKRLNDLLVEVIERYTSENG